jgi:transposase
MKTLVRPRRDFQALEERRQQAAKLFGGGEILASEARTLQVSRQSVSRWYRQWREGGIAALRAVGRAGRKPKLTHPQRQQVDRALRQGAGAHGFGTDLWTLPRVAAVIERLTGVRYPPGPVWRILGSMDWTLQRPARQARERNEEAVRQWVGERCSAVKKTPGAARLGSSSQTRAASPRGPRSAAPGHGAVRHRS